MLSLLPINSSYPQKILQQSSGFARIWAKGGIQRMPSAFTVTCVICMVFLNIVNISSFTR